MENENYNKMAEIKIPLTEEELDLYFDDIEDYSFIVDFDKCEYTGKKMLNYIYNSGMFCELNLSQFDEKLEELLMEYIRFDRTVNIPVLNALWCRILTIYCGGDFGQIDEKQQEFINHFIKKHEDTVEELVIVLKSMEYQMAKIIAEGDGTFEQTPELKVKKIGVNFITIRYDELFWEMIAHLEDLRKVKVYDCNILNDFCYEGRKLSAMLMEEFNPFTVAIFAIEKDKKQGEDNHG